MGFKDGIDIYNHMQSTQPFDILGVSLGRTPQFFHDPLADLGVLPEIVRLGPICFHLQIQIISMFSLRLKCPVHLTASFILGPLPVGFV